MKTRKILVSAFALTIAFASFTSCSSDSGSDLPPIGGYDNADEVAASSLKAYWPLDGNGKEEVSNTNPSSTVATTYTTGIKGQAANFNYGYMAYPEITALNTTSGSVSISCWVKVANNKANPTATSTTSPIFSLTRTGEAFGNLNLMAETHGLVTSDSIQMKGVFRIKKPDGTEFGGDAVNMIKQEPWMDATHTWAANKIGGQWAHVVYVYDGPTATNRIYVNGSKISNSAWEVRNGGAAFPLNHFLPTRPVIGALETVVNGTNVDTWNAALKGGVDELRIYDKTLTTAEIGALYALELAGR
jgi:hypothetical protein